jgi:hypothetical protein
MKVPANGFRAEGQVVGLTASQLHRVGHDLERLQAKVKIFLVVVRLDRFLSRQTSFHTWLVGGLCFRLSEVDVNPISNCGLGVPQLASGG